MSNDETEQPEGIALHVRDLEDQLARAAWARSTLDQAPALIMVLEGPELRVSFVNELFRAAMYGRDLDGLTYREAFPEFAAQGFADLFDTIYRTGKAEFGKGVRADVQGPDGPEERYFDFVWQPWRDAKGVVCGVMTHAVEVTEAFRARRAVEAARLQMRALVSDLSVVVWGLNLATQRFTFVSDHAEKLLGYAPHEWTDFDFWAGLIHPDDRDEAVNTCTLETGAGADHRFEYRAIHRDGRVLWIEDIVRVHKDDDGRPVRLRGVLVDITARKRLEVERANMQRKLLDVQRLESLGVLAGGIAHDFNNLLTGVLGNASVALMDLPETHPARGRVEALSTAARRAADLANQMLAYSGRGHFDVRRIDISAHISEILGLLESTLPKKVQLRLELAEELPPVEADPSQLQQVFMNLVLNGAEAIGDNAGTVIVSTSTQHVDAAYAARLLTTDTLAAGRYVVFEVHDSGCGMDSETRERIFDPFFSTKVSGRGLGLAAVHGIVRGHRGAVNVYSAPGDGTTFKVLLPAVDGPISAAKAAPVATIHRGGTILVVDDEEDVRIAARFMLERLGYQVVEAVDGRKGVARFQEMVGELVAVILDMTMPEMNGEEAFRKMRHIDPTVAIVLSSGYNEVEATRRFTGKGLAAFLQKPYTVEQARAALQPDPPAA